MYLAYAFIAIVLIVAAAPLWQGRSTTARDKAVKAYSHRAGLPLSPEIEPAVRERLVRREKWVLVAGLIGVTIAVIPLRGYRDFGRAAQRRSGFLSWP